MLLSRIADRGTETLILYPEKVVTNTYGAQVRVPDKDNPVSIPVSVSGGRSSDSQLVGQVSAKVLNVTCRSFPAGSFAEAEFRGEKWTLGEPPVDSRFTDATTHYEVVLRSANQVIQQ
jgi:hypothetical protein